MRLSAERRLLSVVNKTLRIAPVLAPATSESAASVSTEQLYRFLVESLTEYAIFAVALDGLVVSWNSGAEQAFGYSRDEMLGASFLKIFTPEDAANGAPQAELAAAKLRGRIDCDRWHVRKDGSRFWATNTVQPLRDGSGTLAGFTKIVRDITDARLAFAALHESEERMRILLDSVEDYAIFSLSKTGHIESWNAGAERLFGHSAQEVLGEYFSMLYTRQDAALGIPENELRQASNCGTSSGDRWHIRKDGSRFFSAGKMSRVRAEQGGETERGFVKVAHDITERKQMEDAMRHEAFHDALTGLPNRSLFIEHLRRSMARSLRSQAKTYAVFFLDVDNFKLLNDNLGHVLADRVLIAFGGRLTRFIRSEDVVARLGGDEFALLISDLAGSHEALAVAGRLQNALNEAFTVDGHQVFTSASVGIAMGLPNYEGPEQVLRDADIAMYAAKTQGRSRSVLFDAAMYQKVIARHQLEGELRTAVRSNELRTVYQPILALDSSRVVGFEALVRWQHPSRGFLSPSDFLATAEETRAIIAIDRWVLRRACRDLSTLHAERHTYPPLTLSVNLSSRQFSDPLLVDQIRDVLRETGFEPTLLKLEITENVLLENSASVASNLEELRALGVELHVDDFGTGYSSLTYLRDLPVSALKIDRSFINGMLTNSGSREIVRSVVSLAHNFDLIAIAEGVETVEQMAALRALDCEYGQGYLFSKPVEWPAARALLAEPLALS